MTPGQRAEVKRLGVPGFVAARRKEAIAFYQAEYERRNQEAIAFRHKYPLAFAGGEGGVMSGQEWQLAMEQLNQFGYSVRFHVPLNQSLPSVWSPEEHAALEQMHSPAGVIARFGAGAVEPSNLFTMTALAPIMWVPGGPEALGLTMLGGQGTEAYGLWKEGRRGEAATALALGLLAAAPAGIRVVKGAVKTMKARSSAGGRQAVVMTIRPAHETLPELGAKRPASRPVTLRTMGAQPYRALPEPVERWLLANMPNAAAVTDFMGNVYYREGRAFKDFAQDITHESGHRFLDFTWLPPRLRRIVSGRSLEEMYAVNTGIKSGLGSGAGIREWFYTHSHFMKGAEEMYCEYPNAGGVRDAYKFVMSSADYSVTPARFFGEPIALVVAGGTIFVLFRRVGAEGRRK